MVTWMFGFCFSNSLTCASVYWPSLARSEMAKVIVCVVLADCCVVLAECCVVLELELQAARLSKATDATALAAYLVLVLAIVRRPTSLVLPRSSWARPTLSVAIVRRIGASGACSTRVNACYAHLLGIRQRILVIIGNN